MKKAWIIIGAMLIASPLSADWVQAVTAHQNQDYKLAKEQFTKLIPYGNKDAAFNLAMMYLYGEGLAADYSMALAHFKLAAELGHQDTDEVLAQLHQNIDEAQLANAQLHLEKLRQVAKWWLLPHDSDVTTVFMSAPVKSEAPVYPPNALKNSVFGYVTLRFLIDEQGAVQIADVIDAFPETTFNQSALRAIKGWRYEATGKKQLRTTRLDFKLNDMVNIDALESLNEQHQLWRGALLGSAQHQFLLGSLLQLLETQKVKQSSVDYALPISAELDLTIIRPASPVKADFAGFVGSVEVRVTEDGTIIEQLKTDFAAGNKLETLVGLKLAGKPDTDVYRLSRPAQQQGKAVRVIPVVTIPASLTARFWWEKAAKNGSKPAQRMMATSDQRWEHILIAEQDAEVMAWAGSRMVLEGEREAGLALLEAAIAKQYGLAPELKKQLM